MKKRLLILTMLATALSVSASHWDGSRTLPVHKIPITDGDGNKIIPTVPDTTPFSAKMTCGACHDYEKISSGRHFNAGDASAPAGRPGEPWMWVDVRTGLQLPVSQRDWPGIYKPEEVGLTPWKFTKQFGTHLPGGGISDPADKFAEVDARWELSGGLEINCLACHNAHARQDMTEWAKQIERENFSWAATAAAGLGEVGGMVSRMPNYWNIYDGPNPDDRTFAVPPSVNYDTALFNAKHQIWFDISKPTDARCLHCHSAHPASKGRLATSPDVHSAVGITCVECHRNEIDHDIQRGTEEPAGSGCEAVEEMSCRACHLDEGSTPGKLGAPIAHHKGIPPIHFEELSCTACHSGQEVASEPTVVRTSRANRLGIYGRAQWFTESPFIVEPVFVKGAEGKIEPHRMMWPAFWATVDGENLHPLQPAQVEAAAKDILDTQKQVTAILSALGGTEGAPGDPLFAAGGKLYEANIDGGLDIVQTSEKIPEGVSWVWKTETNVVSTIPDFDVTAEELDYDAEDAIMAVMEAMNPLGGGRELVAVVKGKLLTLNADGYLERADTTLAQGWYWKGGDQFITLLPAFAERSVIDIVGTDFAFNEEQAAMMLKALSQSLGKPVAYVSNGRKFVLDGDKLADEDHPAAAPVSWAIGHDVRPAAKSLGVKKCAECHSAKADFFFGTVTATGPLKTDRAAVKSMYEFQDVSKNFTKLFGLTFLVRKMFKMAMAAMAMLLVAITLAVGLPALRRLLTGYAADLDEQKGLYPLVGKVTVLAVVVSIAVLALTGFLFGWPISAPLDGYPLIIHVGFGALYAVGLCLLALLRSRSENQTALGRICLWVLIVCGVTLILSILLAMFPILGTHGQHLCLLIHSLAALITLPAAGLLCLLKHKETKTPSQTGARK